MIKEVICLLDTLATMLERMPSSRRSLHVRIYAVFQLSEHAGLGFTPSMACILLFIIVLVNNIRSMIVHSV